MNAGNLIFVALGGAVGSVVRVLIGAAIPAGRLPWGTITVNVLGSLLIGALMARFAGEPTTEALRNQSLLVAGFCGGFTTFSTFSWQTVEAFQQGRAAAAAANIVISVVLCLAATWIGWRVAR